MKNNSALFYEYTEIRRRVERRLANLQIVVSHVLLFGLASMFAYGAQSGSSRGFNYGVMFTFMLWSLVILGHGLWVYRKSGASAKAREAAINDQLVERLEQGDTELLNTQREVFRLQGLLEEDIRKRSGPYNFTVVYIALNAVVWFVSLLSSARLSYPLQMTVPLALMLFVLLTIINVIRRNLREREYMDLLMNWSDQASTQPPKQKRSEDEAAFRLSDDGELVEDYWTESNKAKRTS